MPPWLYGRRPLSYSRHSAALHAGPRTSLTPALLPGCSAYRPWSALLLPALRCAPCRASYELSLTLASGRPRCASSSTRASCSVFGRVGSWRCVCGRAGQSQLRLRRAPASDRSGERCRPAVWSVGWVASGWRPVLVGHSSSGPGTWRGRKRRRPGLVLRLFFAASDVEWLGF